MINEIQNSVKADNYHTYHAYHKNVDNNHTILKKFNKNVKYQRKCNLVIILKKMGLCKDLINIVLGKTQEKRSALDDQFIEHYTGTITFKANFIDNITRKMNFDRLTNLIIKKTNESRQDVCVNQVYRLSEFNIFKHFEDITCTKGLVDDLFKEITVFKFVVEDVDGNKVLDSKITAEILRKEIQEYHASDYIREDLEMILGLIVDKYHIDYINVNRDIVNVHESLFDNYINPETKIPDFEYEDQKVDLFDICELIDVLDNQSEGDDYSYYED